MRVKKFCTMLAGIVLCAPAWAQNHQNHECMFEPMLEHKDFLCHVDYTFVGKITNVSPYIAPSGTLKDYIWSTLTFDVERNIAGVPGAQFVMDIPGGDMNGSSVRASHFPDPEVGRRALVFASETTASTPSSGFHYPTIGEPRFHFFVSLDPNVTLASLQTLRNERTVHCD